MTTQNETAGGKMNETIGTSDAEEENNELERQMNEREWINATQESDMACNESREDQEQEAMYYYGRSKPYLINPLLIGKPLIDRKAFAVLTIPGTKMFCRVAYIGGEYCERCWGCKCISPRVFHPEKVSIFDWCTVSIHEAAKTGIINTAPEYHMMDIYDTVRYCDLREDVREELKRTLDQAWEELEKEEYATMKQMKRSLRYNSDGVITLTHSNEPEED